MHHLLHLPSEVRQVGSAGPESQAWHGDPQMASGTPVLYKHPPSPPRELLRSDAFGMHGLETSPTPPHPSFHCLPGSALETEETQQQDNACPAATSDITHEGRWQ